MKENSFEYLGTSLGLKVVVSPYAVRAFDSMYPTMIDKNTMAIHPKDKDSFLEWFEGFDEKEYVVKYQVYRKDSQCCKLFDTKEEAEDFIKNNSKELFMQGVN